MVLPGRGKALVAMALPQGEQNRINNRLPVAREGLPFIISGLLLTTVLLTFGLIILGIVAAVQGPVEESPYR